jgi:hypothetical protein
MPPFAWTCVDHPERHGSFPQDGLNLLSDIFGAVQPIDRFICPICDASGEPGWMRASTITEADRLFAQHQEA